ncbi:MAG: hypothetical protein RUMPE_00344 [Eubacteriales bacterium SKADARSKE-1]|nr:hypothetical protein [Eubacteriales bacterium SKADARSKE-1]
MDKYYGEKLITLGTAIAFQIAQNCEPEEIEIWSDLFIVVSDQLALLSSTKGKISESSENKRNINKNFTGTNI